MSAKENYCEYTYKCLIYNYIVILTCLYDKEKGKCMCILIQMKFFLKLNKNFNNNFIHK